MEGKEGATVRQEHSDAGEEKDPKTAGKRNKKQSSPTAATSNNASNNNRNKHHTRQLTAAVSSLSPIFMAARHRTPRESIAPLPSSFPRLPPTSSHGTQSGPSTPVATPPSTTQQSTAQKPLRKSHTATKHATQHRLTWTPPSEERHVNRLAGTRYNQSTEQREVRQALDQGLSTHTALLMPPLLPRVRYPSGK
ncbi:hypothetical protein TcCL_NonESM12111 [Trypanosoma cruzi]|nr:hypothetical protein TcCL_NonESM12111 [Trypanosoma cruzi]